MHARGTCFADCKWDGTDRWEIGEGQDCLDNIGNLVAAIRHAERHAETTIVGPDGEDMTIESGIKRRPAYNVCDVLSLIYTNLRRYTDLSAALHVRFRDDLLAVTRRSHAFAAGVPRMAPNPLYPRSRASFASGRRCCSLFMRVTCCGTRTVLPCTGSAMFQVEMSRFETRHAARRGCRAVSPAAQVYMWSCCVA